jgi:tripartite-type tricarboxylate transporter receptor subunit TctC
MSRALLVVALLLAALAPARADDYPQRTVTFVCPFPAGGGTDILTRMLAQELQDKLKQPFIVENRPGAATILAASTVAKSAPDGYTLLLAPITTLSLNPNVYKSLPYDPVKDFAPIGLVGQSEFVLVANPKLGAATFADLIAQIKAKPGEMSFGTSGRGTPHHIFMELLIRMADLKMQHVPYRGSGPALTDVVSGEIPLMIVDLAVALPMIHEGKVKAYAVPSPERVKALPDVPTIAEAGIPGYGATGWFSVVARAGTPRQAIDTINRVLSDYIRRPEVQDKLLAIGIRPRTSTPEELAAVIVSEGEKWGRVVREAGITLE